MQCTAEHGECERKLARLRDVPAEDRTSRLRRHTSDAARQRIELHAPALGDREREQQAERRCRHGSEIAERRGRCARANLLGAEPLAPEMHVLHGGIGADDEPLAGGDVEDGRVVADADGERTPRREQTANRVELRALGHGEMWRGAHARSPTLGNSASTGGRARGGASDHTCGSVARTSSSV